MAELRTFTSGADRVVVRSGDDLILDLLGGDDTLTVQGGTVLAYLRGGNDIVRVDSGNARLYGQAGADRFDIYASGTRINGGSDDDLFNIRGGSNHLFDGSHGNDRFNILVDTTNARLFGEGGDDLFVGYSRSISGQLYGEDGNDRFLNFGNHDGRVVTLYGGAGNDLYRIDAGSPPAIVELAGQGTDTVQVNAGSTYVLPANVENLFVIGAGSGSSELTGNGLANRIAIGSGGGTVNGAGGNDRLEGGAGADLIYGGSGNDRITGGGAHDVLYGGAGADIFVYLSVGDADPGGPMGLDWIGDWTAEDRVDLRGIDANVQLEGHQSFVFAGGWFGTPITNNSIGTVAIAGFGGDLYIMGHVDSDGIADFAINLWSTGGESALTEDSLIL